MTDGGQAESPRARLLRLAKDRRVRLVVRALALAWLVFFWLYLVGAQSTFDEVDAEAYWGLTLDGLYRDVQLGDQDAFLYSPLVAYLFLPFSALPYEVFYGLLAAVNLVALVWILRPELAALSLFLVPVSNEVARGNVHILIAAAIVLGFRYAAAWAWPLLTKVTPGIGVFWFAVRREWRPFAIALGFTSALVAVSFVLTPDLWFRWFEVLTGSVTITRPSVAAVLVVLAAARSWHPLLPVACLLALPAIWVNSLSMLVAVVPLWGLMTRGRQPAGEAAPTGEGEAA
jgi:hypothetical protein